MTDSTPSEATVLQPDLSLALERITDGFFALDADWRFAYMNAEARKLLHAHGDVIGNYWLDVFPKSRGGRFEREYKRAMREQMPVQFVEYSVNAERWLEVKAYPSPDGISVYFRDVSARIEAQREIERNTRRQQALIDFGRATLGGLPFSELIDDAIELVRDIVETQIVEIYDFERSSGHFTVRRATGWPAQSSFDPNAPMVSHLRLALESGNAFVCSDVRIDPRAPALTALSKSGALACVCVVIGTPKEPVGAVAAYSPQPRAFTVGDVRFVESIAQAVTEAATAVESNRRMAQVLESIRDAFVAVDRDLRISYVNARMAQFWRVDAHELVGAHVSRFTDTLDDSAAALEHFRLALEQDRAETFERQYLGSWYEVRLFPFSNGVAGYIQDITDRKREQARVLSINAELERRVAARTKQLELANKELESFSYSVSHDLRAPLRAIDGFSQALVEDYGETLEDRGRGYLDRVRKAAQRMADLIDALLKLARVARHAIGWQPVDLSEISLSVVEDLRQSYPDRAVEVSVQPGLVAPGEPNLLHTVLENLIINAWKFTRDREDARIEVGRGPDGNEFFVRDNGAGFDMTYQNKLFGAFQRLHSTEEYEGTGIGLATVARIIHRHGGSIRADGAVGMGATFYFTLPSPADGATTI